MLTRALQLTMSPLTPSSTSTLASEPTRKPRERSQTPNPGAQPTRKPRLNKDAPRSSAQAPTSKCRVLLTLHDWLTVFHFMDEHPEMTQDDIALHFANRPEGALIFGQTALSKKLKQRPELEARVGSNPTALSGKRLRVTTRPDVERCLVLWVNHMRQRGEVVNGHMLRIVRGKFEDDLQVPENQRLRAGGWVQSFCKAWNLKEHRRHGEAGSVDLEAVERERARISVLLKDYDGRDILNFDETAFFPL